MQVLLIASFVLIGIFGNAVKLMTFGVDNKKIVTMWAIFAALLFWANGCTINNTTEEDTMSTVKFYAMASFALPASPGDDNTNLAISGSSLLGGTFMGYNTPKIAAPSGTDLAEGCSPESGIRIKAYRFTFLGVQGLRPGATTSQSGVYLIANRKGATSTDHAYLPFVSNDWEPVDIWLPVDAAIANPYHTLRVSIIDLFADTRNLQSLYYGADAVMLLEIETDCKTTF